MTLILAATTSLVWGQNQKSANAPQNMSLVGTWQVLRHGVDCTSGQQLGPDFHALMTFSRGGTLNAYAVTPGATVATTTPEFGNWSHTANSHVFTFHDVGYNYDESGAFVGRGEITSTDLEIDSSGQTFTYDATIAVYDADGNLLFSFCGHGSGTRFE